MQKATDRVARISFSLFTTLLALCLMLTTFSRDSVLPGDRLVPKLLASAIPFLISCSLSLASLRTAQMERFYEALARVIFVLASAVLTLVLLMSILG